jgi:hypothetical protein
VFGPVCTGEQVLTTPVRSRVEPVLRAPTFADTHKNRTRVKNITHVSDLRFEKVLF